MSDFRSTRLSLRTLQAMPNQSFIAIIDCVERGEHFNKWRRQTEVRLEVFFADGHSVVLNDGMEQTIIGAYGTDAGSWTGRPLTDSGASPTRTTPAPSAVGSRVAARR